MKNLARIKEVIIKALDLGQIMLDYNVGFTFSPLRADEVQFRCPFHGKDNKPSARYYNATQSCYCWVCKKSWDVVTFIMGKEGLGYKQAIIFILDRYKIDVSSVPDEPEIIKISVSINRENIILDLMRRRLDDLRKLMPFEKYRDLCQVYVMIQYYKFKEKPVSEYIKKLENKMETLLCLK